MRVLKPAIEKHEKIGNTEKKITPFSIADILTKETCAEENQAIDMSSKCITYSTPGKMYPSTLYSRIMFSFYHSLPYAFFFQT